MVVQWPRSAVSVAGKVGRGSTSPCRTSQSGARTFTGVLPGHPDRGRRTSRLSGADVAKKAYEAAPPLLAGQLANLGMYDRPARAHGAGRQIARGPGGERVVLAPSRVVHA